MLKKENKGKSEDTWSDKDLKAVTILRMKATASGDKSKENITVQVEGRRSVSISHPKVSTL